MKDLLGNPHQIRSKVSNLRDRFVFNSRNFAISSGLMGGHSDYVKFIILGRSRTGSTLLRSLLNSHSQIVTYNEIFRNYNEPLWDANLPKSTKTLALMQERPLEFLESTAFRPFPRHISAVGFKLFYYHAHNEAWMPIWSYLKDRKDLKIIHIKRKNILKTHLSHKRALDNHTWVKTSAPIQKNAAMTLTYEECLKSFQGTIAWEKEYDEFFKDHEMIEVVYENLAKDFQTEMQYVQQFLEVDSKPLKPATFKQSHGKLSAQIANYDEIKARFMGTLWEKFFEE
ncbi:MAG: sulfotransferase domain-containing protein [Anaerolineae bacterium]|nr:sulfotransferase domain-containing protein [Anaerolineae bacterium]